MPLSHRILRKTSGFDIRWASASVARDALPVETWRGIGAASTPVGAWTVTTKHEFV